jgi:pimeloyl-ACP methyl ester carboxylesterase/CRP-like cAMP-binding protein
MAVYTIDNQPVYVQECGPEHGPLAVLIHGWSSSSFTWKPVLPMLSRRYRCIAVDLPGFGQSPALPHPPTIAGYVDMIARIVEHASERPALLLGHSMGGQIAATLALRHPMLVERMVLLNPALSGRLSKRVNLLLAPHVLAERYPFMEWLLHVLAKTPLDYTDFLLKPSNFAERATVSDEDYRHIREDARRRGQGGVRAASLGAMRAADLRGLMGAIEPPALVVWGAEDGIVPLRDAGAVAAEWPAADLRIIPNAGHWPQFEQSSLTLRHISHFLGLPPAAAAAQEDEQDLARIQEIAQFLNNSEVGGNLSLAQRLRLASLLRFRSFEPREEIASANTAGDEMYIIMDGTLEVWLSPAQAGGERVEPVRLAFLLAGQVVGELALLENIARSADLRAGPSGVTVLALGRAAFNTLAEDDPAMGVRLMQNLAVSLGKRLRLQNWQHLRAEERLAQQGAVTRVLLHHE